MGDVRMFAGSREPLLTTAKKNGQPADHEVALVPFVTGLEREPDPDADVWQAAPMMVEGMEPGYFHIFTLVRDGQAAVIRSAGHLVLL